MMKASEEKRKELRKKHHKLLFKLETIEEFQRYKFIRNFAMDRMKAEKNLITFSEAFHKDEQTWEDTRLQW